MSGRNRKRYNQKGRRGKDQLQRRSGPLYLIPWSPCNRNRSDRPEGLPLRFLNKERQVYSERSMPIHGFCSRPFPRLSLPISNFPVLQATSPHPPQSRDLRALCKGNALGHINDHAPGEVYARRQICSIYPAPKMLFSPVDFPLHTALKS